MSEALHPLEISCADYNGWRSEGREHMLLDCREPHEYDTAAIDGATLVPLGEIPGRVGELPRDQPIVVHCHHGARSLRAAEFLNQQGFENVKSLAGGIDEWSLEVDPEVPRY